MQFTTEAVKNNNFGFKVGDKVVVEEMVKEENKMIIKKITGIVEYITDWNIGVRLKNYVVSFGKIEMFTPSARCLRLAGIRFKKG